MSDNPIIYIFCSTHDGGEGPAYAMAADGKIVLIRWAKNETAAKHMLDSNHPEYARHYRQGYELVFVPCKDLETHKGLLKARRLNEDLGRQC